MNYRENLKDKKRIVVKIGSSSITHPETGALNLTKLEVLVRELCDLKNRGKEVILVSSGAIAVGRQAIGVHHRPKNVSEKQACAAIGQAQLMMTYQKLFSEYGHRAAQILMTKNTMIDNLSRRNASNTFDELIKLGAIPVVNENDTVSTYEIQFGDNDTLSAIVSALTHADLLLLLSDIDGLYTDDPRKNPGAQFIDLVDKVDDHYMKMGKGHIPAPFPVIPRTGESPGIPVSLQSKNSTPCRYSAGPYPNSTPHRQDRFPAPAGTESHPFSPYKCDHPGRRE